MPAVTRFAASDGDPLFALGRDGRVYAWEGYGNQDPPAAVENIEGASDVAVDARRLCAIVEGGRVRCATAVLRATDHCDSTQDEFELLPAEPVPGIEGAQQIAIAADFGCVTRANHGVTCWGSTEKLGPKAATKEALRHLGRPIDIYP